MLLLCGMSMRSLMLPTFGLTIPSMICLYSSSPLLSSDAAHAHFLKALLPPAYPCFDPLLVLHSRPITAHPYPIPLTRIPPPGTIPLRHLCGPRPVAAQCGACFLAPPCRPQGSPSSCTPCPPPTRPCGCCSPGERAPPVLAHRSIHPCRANTTHRHTLRHRTSLDQTSTQILQ